MPEKTQEERVEQFETYNPYAEKAAQITDELPRNDRNAGFVLVGCCLIAVAYEIERLRGQIRFGGGSK